MKRFFFFNLFFLCALSMFAFRVQDEKTNAWATYYTTAGYERSLTNGWASSNVQTDKNGIYFMPFKLDGDFLTSQLFDAQNNALAIIMEIYMPSGGVKQCKLLGLNSDSAVVETLNVTLNGGDFTSGENKYFNEAVFVFENKNRDIRRVRFEYGNDIGSTQYVRMQWFEIRDTTFIPTNVATTTTKQLQVYKKAEFLIVSDVTDGTTIELYTTIGKNVMQKPLYNGMISVATLPKGIYIVRAGKMITKIAL
ncbi:MAG: T9SS type A sorting domain-containing protein [Sphingobacteriia bacterium]|mgnify:CR=1 FL=1|jgi:hypothetical protein|nr:T9SS type A sorting domain-containing protein [Paludibacteraceae bacterium]NCA78761.1 T9SS type A sorting domain-containing protein [Sphingobacteriia bacterium]